MERQRAPGLRYRADGSPIWRASKPAVKQGYPVKSVNLIDLKHRPGELVSRCTRLQKEMDEWLAGGKTMTPTFTGTFKSLFDLYETHPESTYHGLKGSSRESYDCYLRMMRQEIGDVLIDQTDGLSFKRWFKAWSEGGKRIAKAHLCLAIIKAALVFAVTCRKPGCMDLLEILRETIKDKKALPACKPRSAYITFRGVIELRKAAHQLGHPSAALAYALQFEGDQRQQDVIGKWVRLDEPTPPTDVVFRGTKWHGPVWKMVKNDVLTWRPTKTESTTGKEVILPLNEYPMVVEELKHHPVASRKGPLIVNPETGLPYSGHQWNDLWREVCKIAGIDSAVNWNRDLRASGITEGDEADAAVEDAATQAGHNPLTTKRTYIRGHRAVIRLAEARRDYRKRMN
jgi:hypothetical protein